MLKTPDGATDTVGIMPGTMLGTILTGVKLTTDMLQTTTYTVTIQEKNVGTPYEDQRVIIQISSSDYLKNKQQMMPDVLYSWDEQCRTQGTGAPLTDGAPEAMYEEITGEKAQTGKTYDILYSANEDYINNPYIGTVSFDQDGNATISVNTAGYSAVLVETDIWTGEQRKFDLTKY